MFDGVYFRDFGLGKFVQEMTRIRKEIVIQQLKQSFQLQGGISHKLIGDSSLWYGMTASSFRMTASGNEE